MDRFFLPGMPADPQDDNRKYKYSKRKICRHPYCNEFIYDGAQVCPEHRHYYQHIRECARRLVELLDRTREVDGLGYHPAMWYHGESFSISREWAAMVEEP